MRGKNMLLRATSALTLVAAAITIATAPAGAQQKVTLRVADSLPIGHIITTTATKPWIELVKELSGGRIEVQYFPAEQLGKAKDFLQLTQSGLVDIGYVGPSYIADKMPLSAVAELPGAFASSCQVMTAYWKLAKEGEFLYEQEFKPNRIRPLFIAALPPYQAVLGATANVTNLASLAGKKLRASGGAQDLTLRKFGIVPVRMAPPEIYEALSRGTIDGTVLSFVSVESYKLTDIVKSATVGQNFGAVVTTYSISDAKWQRLPKELQVALTKAGDEIVRSSCINFDRQESSAVGRLEAAGVKLIRFDTADQAKLDAAADEIAAEWAKTLDQRGKQGSAALKAFRAALAETSR
jgi:TRAP-type C4-dicarboxylate transport system substrate-binding protein